MAHKVLSLMIAAVDERNAAGVAGGVSRLIRSGTLAPGQRLPTVREFAAALGTSPTTVSQAWSLLIREGLISPQGRRGTFVAGEQSTRAIWRVRRTMGSPGRPALDLSTGTPDLGLLPDMAAVIRRIAPSDHTRGYYDEPVIAELEDKLRERWPYEPQSLTVVDGAMDALDRVVGELVHLGSRVIVEDPAYPPLLDLLELTGAQLIPVTLDAEGIVPDSLAAALAQQPTALFLQPRAHNPSGVSMTTARAAELARLLRGSGVLIVEDDHSGDIAQAAPVSLGSWLPESTVHIQSFSKSYGPDLRLAAMGGPADVIGPLADRRLLGPGWSSRLLQQILLELLRDTTTQAAVAHARTTYTGRRAALLAALAGCGIQAQAADGINAWVPVQDEQTTVLALATSGIGVAAGSPFAVRPAPVEHIRVTAGLLRADYERVAHLIAAADLSSSTPVRHSGSGRRRA